MYCDIEGINIPCHDAVAVPRRYRATSSLDSVAHRPRANLRDPRLYFTATDLCVVLQLAPYRAKCIRDRRVDIVVNFAAPRIMHDRDLAPRNRQGDAHLEPRALMLMAVRQVDPDMATLDPIVDALEALHPACDGDLDGRTWEHTVKRDRERN
jgi:hypothetical protein